MFDKHGFWQKQKVHEGVTQSGIRGLFTGNTLACPLRDGDDAKQKAAQMGFEFEEGPMECSMGPHLRGATKENRKWQH